MNSVPITIISQQNKSIWNKDFLPFSQNCSAVVLNKIHE